MGVIRAALGWIGGHRKTTAVAAAALLLAVAGARELRRRSEALFSARLERGEIVEAVYGIGTVTANRSYQIKVGVVSHLREIFVKEGDSALRGQRLLDLDGVVYSAPFGGTVVFLPYKIGENVFTGLPVLVLVDLSDRYVVVNLEQQAALRLRPGQRAVLSFDTMRAQRFVGRVRSVYSYGGSFLARVDVDDLPAAVLPDMTGDVAIEVARKPDALVAPAAALDRGALWIKRGRAPPRRVEVATGLVDKDRVEIVSGDARAGDAALIKARPGR